MRLKKEIISIASFKPIPKIPTGGEIYRNGKTVFDDLYFSIDDNYGWLKSNILELNKRISILDDVLSKSDKAVKNHQSKKINDFKSFVSTKKDRLLKHLNAFEIQKADIESRRDKEEEEFEKKEKELNNTILDEKIFESNLQKILNEVFKDFTLFQSTDSDELKNTLYREYLLRVEFAYHTKLGNKIKTGKVNLKDWQQFEIDIKYNIKIATPEVLNKLNGVRKDTEESVQVQINEVYQILEKLPPLLFEEKPAIPIRKFIFYVIKELQFLIDENKINHTLIDNRKLEDISKIVWESMNNKYSNIKPRNTVCDYLTSHIEIIQLKDKYKVQKITT